MSARLRVLVCPQEFKGSLTAAQAAAALAAGVRRALPSAEVRALPMADGGPGTAEIVAGAAGGRLVDCAARGPLGARVEGARYALIDEARVPASTGTRAATGAGAATPGGGAAGVAVVEAAATAGLVLVPAERRDPARASTEGVGEQIAHALAAGARRVIVGVGGTGTNDGGSGAARALGLRLLDRNGDALPPGAVHLARLARVDASGVIAALRAAEVRVAVDVTNPLLGPQGATAIYGPQKGGADWLAPALEEALARWAERLGADLGVDLAETAGTGAGGGLPVGLVAVARAGGARASIESGAALVADAVGLRAAVAAADLVVTGEGRLDAQTAFGKAVAHVAGIAAELGRPCLAVAGSIDGVPPSIVDAEPLIAGRVAPEDAMRRAVPLAEAAAARLVARHAGVAAP